MARLTTGNIRPVVVDGGGVTVAVVVVAVDY